MKKRSSAPGDNEFLRTLSKEKFISDKIIDHSRSMISIINKNYIYEKVNHTFCTAHKVVNDSIVGKSLGDVWGHDTFNNIIKKNVDLCFSGKTVSYEAVFKTPGSESRYFEVVFRPVVFESGVITHILAETFDINELKHSKQLAIEKEEELRKIETNIPIGLLRCSPDGQILHTNKAFLNIMECDDENTMIKLNLKDFYPDKGLFELHMEQLLKCKTKTFGRIPLINFKGNEMPSRLSGFLALDESGSPSFIDFAVEDSSRELMLENRLLQAQKLETIGALAGGIAHDFNNILATISGYSEILLDDLPKDSQLSDKVSKILGAVTKAQSLTKQILTFSRQVEQEKITVSVAEVLKETIGFFKSAVPSNIIIKSSIPRENTIVYADPTQLFRVFLNLMTNAMQSMEENGGTLSVELTIVQGDLIQHELNKDIVADEYVLLTFKDTGEGMDQLQVTRIFEPFYTTRDVGKGTGLGLSVVQGIIAELEGEILVSSGKGKGSVFYVYLPVSKYNPESTIKDVKKKKILFITGNKYESRIFSLALENTGYELVYISDRSSLHKVMSVINNLPDLVIYMSDTKQIETDDLIDVFRHYNINIPCILITDSSPTLLEEKLLNSGIIKNHLIKPVSLKEIRNAIKVSI